MSGTQEPGGNAWGTPDSGVPGPAPMTGGQPPAGQPNAGQPNPGRPNPGPGAGGGTDGGPGDPGAPDGRTGWGPAPEPGSPHRRPGDDAFARLREFGAYRSSEGRWVAGVASGLARRFDIDQTLIRGAFVALSIVGGLGVALYGICWLLLPQEEDGRIHLQEAIRGRFSAGFFAAVVLSFAAIGGGGPWSHNGAGFWGFPGTIILAVLIVGGLWWMARNLPQPNGRGGAQPLNQPGAQPDPNAAGSSGLPYWTTPEGSRELGEKAARWGRETGDAISAWGKDFGNRQRTAHEEAAWQHHEAQRLVRARTAPSRRVRQVTLGLALIVATVVLMTEAFGDLPGWAGLTALGAAITVIAGGVVANGLMGRRSPGLAGLGILLTLFLSVGAVAQHAGVETSRHMAVIGSTSWTPKSAGDAASQYNLAIGEARLNITPAALEGATPTDPLEIQVNVGVGHLVLNLPAWAGYEVDARLGAGEMVEPGGAAYEVKGDSGNRSRTFTGGEGDPVLKIVAQQGVGQLEMNRVSQSGAEVEGAN
ncbi:PspC domain-containing protein [Kineosporia succinea]|uniref:Phage shock protein PspC (Stress-responsive transcriptional regulator) n=1 Tax=Kineosporia succinea TaxID=84632 RepID=A0ABT9P4C8_9ACTN|nr:PspC domain-containing protein [Kineosporia succinea]MDP9827264.1 phage shock protein PspC (stress-responsive transcriptional regulator) [Kineosporia succinea]